MQPNREPNFRWKDADPDIRLFAIVGIPMIAVLLYLKSVGFFGPEPPSDWSMPAEQLAPIEEGLVD